MANILPFKPKTKQRGRSVNTQDAEKTYAGVKPLTPERLQQVMDEMGLVTSKGKQEEPTSIAKFREQKNPERG